MVCVGYLIIMKGQNIKKIGFENFHFRAAESGNLRKQVVPLAPVQTTKKAEKHIKRV